MLRDRLSSMTLDVENKLIDLLCKVIKWEEMAKNARDEVYAAAFFSSREPTQKGRDNAALCDKEYNESVATYATAKAVLKWMERKLDTISKRHYLCKEVLAAHGRLRGGEDDGHLRNRGRRDASFPSDALGGDADLLGNDPGQG